MIYSSVPTVMENYDFGGIAKCNSITGFLPAVGEMIGGCLAMQHGNIIKVGLITDLHFYEYPDEFMSILHKNFDKFNRGEKIEVSNTKNNLKIM